jgi:hypothetical protein
VPFTILRPVLVYGPGVKGNLRALMRLAALPVPLPFGALTARRSLLSLAKLTDAITFVLRHDGCAGETDVVADPAPLTVAEIAAALRRGIGRKWAHRSAAGAAPVGARGARARRELGSDQRGAGGGPAEADGGGVASGGGHGGRAGGDDAQAGGGRMSRNRDTLFRYDTTEMPRLAPRLRPM